MKEQSDLIAEISDIRNEPKREMAVYTKRYGRMFRLPVSLLEQLNCLTDLQAGQLFKCILEYQNRGTCKTDDRVVRMAMSWLSTQFDLDNEHYAMIVNRNRKNGAKGGRPPKS